MRVLVAHTGPTLRTPRTLHLDEAVGERAAGGGGEGEQKETQRVTHQKLPWSEAPFSPTVTAGIASDGILR